MKNKYNILIVDNDKNELSAIKKFLKKEIYNIDTTISALDALIQVKNDKYHIILLNIDTSDMDGIELLKEIKKYDAMSQVIVMTNNSTMDKIFTCLELGANDYISNPCDNTQNVMNIIKCSVEKLERWRNSVIEIVK